MDRRVFLLPLLALAGTSLSGCVAVAIPALAGSAMFGTRIDGKDGSENEQPASQPAPAVAAVAPRPAPAANPTVTVMPPAAQPAPARVVATAPVAPAPAPAPVVVRAPAIATAPRPVVPPAAATATPRITTVIDDPAPAVASAVRPATPPAAAPPRVAAPQTAPVVAAAPRPVTAAPAASAPVTRPAAPVTPAVAAAAVPAAAPRAPTTPPPASYPDPSRPLPPDQNSFARFVRYGQASARGVGGGADLSSAMLSDPVALDGKRRRCAVGEQLVALIDLDPAGGVFAPPASAAKQPGLALGLAVLREAGVEIAWLSDLPVNQSGALRSVLEQAGLDPRGEDIISLRRDENDSKQQRKENLAGITCIIAIAGDERPDFDERYRYLRSPEAGAGLEPVIGDGWFLIAPLFPEAGNAGQ